MSEEDENPVVGGGGVPLGGYGGGDSAALMAQAMLRVAEKMEKSLRVSEGGTIKGIAMPKCDGTRGQWPQFMYALGNYAQAHGFLGALSTKPEANLPTSSLDEASLSSEEKVALKRNGLVLTVLSSAFSDQQVLLDLVMGTKTKEFPYGVAWKAMELLEKKMAPTDRQAKREGKTAMKKLVMGPKDDPEEFIVKMNKVKLSHPAAGFTEEDLMVELEGKVPTEYKKVLLTESQVKGEALTMRDYERAMRDHYRLHYGDETSPVQNIGLISCYRCGKEGHKGYQCTAKASEKQGGGGKFKGKCNTCGKVGHKAANCWNDPKNASKVPEWMKKKMKDGNSTKEATLVTTDASEKVMAAVESTLVTVNESEYVFAPFDNV